MSKKKSVIAVVILLVLILAAVSVYIIFSPKSVEGEKNISFEVYHSDGTVNQFSINTDAENLRGALEQEGLISGDESEYGLYVTVVDGETADSSQNQWWCFSKSGEMLMTGVDDTVIADGEHYEAVISVW